MLADWTEVTYLGHAASGLEGLQQCELLNPDVVILDLSLPDIDGFELAEKLIAFSTPPRLVALSIRTDDVALFQLNRCLISALVWKSPGCAAGLRHALSIAAAGASYLPPDVQEAMRRFRSAPDAFFKLLSDREISLLPLLAQGKSDGEIAAAKGLSPATIHSHRTRIMWKLNIHRTPELMRWAIDKGFSRQNSLSAESSR